MSRCMKRSSATGRSVSANAKNTSTSRHTAQAGVHRVNTLDSGLAGMRNLNYHNLRPHQAVILPRSLLNILMKFPACSFSCGSLIGATF